MPWNMLLDCNYTFKKSVLDIQCMHYPSAVTIAVHHQAFTMKTFVQTLNGMVLLVGMWKMKSFSSGIIYCVHCRFKLIFAKRQACGQALPCHHNLVLCSTIVQQAWCSCEFSNMQLKKCIIPLVALSWSSWWLCCDECMLVQSMGDCWLVYVDCTALPNSWCINDYFLMIHAKPEAWITQPDIKQQDWNMKLKSKHALNFLVPCLGWLRQMIRISFTNSLFLLSAMIWNLLQTPLIWYHSELWWRPH